MSLALLPASLLAQTAQDPARADSLGRLYRPDVVQIREATTARDDDALIQALEHKLRCTCGCNLDVYTCRTTDFTCATSPAMHRTVLARIDSGQTPEQVIAAFEAQYGQSILMQPPKRGFNWTAYVMPFVGLGIGMGLLGLAMRRIVRTRRGDSQSLEPPVEAPPMAADDMEKLKRELERFEA